MASYNTAWKSWGAQILFYVQAPPSILMSKTISVTLVGRSNLTPLDIAECHGWAWLHLDDLGRVTLGVAARPRVAAIQPVHVAGSIPPHAENENHTPGERAAHALQSIEAVKCSCAGSNTELFSHAISWLGALDVNGCVLDDLAILDVQAANLGQDAVGGWELRDDSEGTGSIDDQPGAVVGVVSESVVVVAAAVLVANAFGLTFLACAGVDTVYAARVGSVGGGRVVSLPDVHFIAA